MRPALMCWIVSPEPQASTFATASPGPATGSGISTRSNGVAGALRIIAFILTPDHSLNMKFAALRNSVRLTPSECRKAAASRISFSTPNSFI